MVSLGPGINAFHLKKFTLFPPLSPPDVVVVVVSDATSFVGPAVKPKGRSFRHALRSAIRRCVAIDDI